MADPKLFVVGSGRCGTLSWAWALYGRHEAHHTQMTLMLPYLACGSLSQDDAASFLNSVPDWYPVEAAWYFTPLVPALDMLYEPYWVWTVRRPKDTVASMIHKGWYRDRDEQDWPVAFMSILPGPLRGQDDTGMWGWWPNYAGCRIRAYQTGHMTLNEWDSLDQVQRCAWWWWWSADRLAKTLPEDRTRVSRLGQDPDMVEIGRWCGLKHRLSLPRINEGHGPALSAEDGEKVDAICGDMEQLIWG